MDVRTAGDELPALNAIASTVGADWPTYRQEGPGRSAFVQEGGVVYHMYSAYGRRRRRGLGHVPVAVVSGYGDWSA
jgi:hypothetical protein